MTELFDIELANKINKSEDLTILTIKNFLNNNRRYVRDLKTLLVNQQMDEIYMKVYNVQTFAVHIGSKSIVESGGLVVKDIENEEFNIINFDNYLKDFDKTYLDLETYIRSHQGIVRHHRAYLYR